MINCRKSFNVTQVRRVIGIVVAALLYCLTSNVSAASSLRETVCVASTAAKLSKEAASRVSGMVAVAKKHQLGIAGAFLTVFLRNDSMDEVNRGLVAGSGLLRHLLAKQRDFGEWPTDVKFPVHTDQPCQPGQVFIEISILLNEKPLTDPQR